MKLHNYTPHKIRIFKQDGSFTEFESTGVARVRTHEKDSKTKHGIQFCTVVDEVVEGLPEPKKNHYYIVSSMVQMASDRTDLLSPTDFVRNHNGVRTGCRRLRERRLEVENEHKAS